ncbi:MAG TPA: fibro-slime domain-containing protein, partial [Polyangiaceae bacterium]
AEIPRRQGGAANGKLDADSAHHVTFSNMRRRVSFLRLKALGWIYLVFGCAADKPSEAPSTLVCTPGEQRACACLDGLQGIQVCKDDGSALGMCTGCSNGNAGNGSAGNGNVGAIGGAPAQRSSLGGTNGSVIASGGVSAAAPSIGGQASGAGRSSATASTAAPSAGANDRGGGAGSGGVSGGTLGNSEPPSNGGISGSLSAAHGGADVGPLSGGTAGVANSITKPNAGATFTSGGVATGGAAGAAGGYISAACGDGIVGPGESCDVLPKDFDMGDGCSPTCRIEPSCPPMGGICTTRCGDGLVAGGEACDDGNAVSGDGCSAECALESGFECTATSADAAFVLPLVVRDFNAGGDFEKGSVFAMGLDYATQELVNIGLDPLGRKPTLKQTAGLYYGVTGKDSGIASAASFSQWFDDGAAPSVNTHTRTLASTLNLYPKTDGSGYANRFGKDGDGLNDQQYLRVTREQCGVVGKEDHNADGSAIPCTVCYYDPIPGTPECDQKDPTRCQKDPTFQKCELSSDGKDWHGVFLDARFDGNPLFFPADAITPADPARTAQVAGNYDPSWPASPGVHNFSFTTEVRFWFKYDSAQTYRLTFVGDDDVWVFVNKRLALDLGGIHMPVQGDLTLAQGVAATVVRNVGAGKAATVTGAPELGTFVDGGIYEVAVFHSERQSAASSYRLEVSTGFRSAPSLCRPK